MARQDQILTDVSVVMSVFNGEATLPRTLQSLDQQHEIIPEIIVVNDGSTDNSAGILDRHADANANYRIFHQSNQGLTAALIFGCRQATGKFIARQDDGDISMPQRLLRQMKAFDDQQDLAMVSCATGFIDQEGCQVFDVIQDAAMAESGLLQNKAELITGPPHHGGVMFRKDLYLQAGGYRSQFYVAQDLDLWIRMRELGRHVSLQQILYQADLSPNAISFSHRQIQHQVTTLILRARELRCNGKSEQELLDQVYSLSRNPPRSTRDSRSDYYFFIGGCQRHTRPVSARRSYWRAIQTNPLHWKAILRYLQTLLTG